MLGEALDALPRDHLSKNVWRGALRRKLGPVSGAVGRFAARGGRQRPWPRAAHYKRRGCPKLRVPPCCVAVHGSRLALFGD